MTQQKLDLPDSNLHWLSTGEEKSLLEQLEEVPDVSLLSSSQVKDRQKMMEEARDITEKDPDAFEFFMEFFFGFAPNKYQSQWAQFQKDNKITIFLGPRNTSKSRILLHYFALWKLCRDTTRHLRQLIASKIDTKASFLMRGITKQIYMNPLLKVFDLKIDGTRPATRFEMSFVPSTPRYNPDPNLAAVGLGSSIIAPHFDIIYVDDAVDKWNAQGKARDMLLANIDFDLWGMMERGHEEIHFIGTRYDDEDGYVELEKRPGFRLFEQSIFADEEETETIDPERVPMSSIKLAQNTLSHSAFRLQYRMKRQEKIQGGLSVSESWFRPESSKRIFDFEHRYMGVDLAGWSANQPFETLTRVSESSIVTIGKDESGFCILDTWHDQIEAPLLLKMIQMKNSHLLPDWIAIENVALQVLFVQFASHLGLPIRKYNARAFGAKEIRAGRLASILSWGIRYLPNVDISSFFRLPSDIGDAAIAVFDLLNQGAGSESKQVEMGMIEIQDIVEIVEI